MSHSSKESGSSKSSIRSRAVSLPLACCASMRFWPPPMRAAARFSSSWRMILYMRHLGDSGVLQSWAMEARRPGRFLTICVTACRSSVSLLGAVQVSQQPVSGGGRGLASSGHGAADHLQAMLDLEVLPEPGAKAAVNERPHPIHGLALALRLQLAALGNHLAEAFDLSPEGVDACSRHRAQCNHRRPPVG